MADRFWVGGTGTWNGSDQTNWSASSGGGGGASVPTSADAVIFDSSSGGGTVTISGTVPCLTFSHTGGTMTLTGTTSDKVQVYGNAALVFKCTNALTVTVDTLFELVYSGSTGTRTYIGPTSTVNGPKLAVTAGSDTVAVTNRCRGVDFTGFAGTLSNTARTLFGHLTLASGMTVTDGANSTTFTAVAGAPNPYTVTSNGVAFPAPVIFSGATWGFGLADALNMGARGLTMTASTSSTFDTNSYALTAASITATAAGARTLTFGTSTVTLSGSGTVFDMSGATTTVSAASATFICNSASAKTFVGSAKTYGTLTQAGAGALTMGGSTFTTINNSVQPTTVTMTSGTTTTVTNFNLSGTAGNLVTLNSTTPGSAATLSKASGTVSVDYLSIQDSTATGGATWSAGANSTNVSGNTGWAFQYAVAAGLGSFSLTGQSATLAFGRVVRAQAGAFSLTGAASGLRVARRVSASAGTFALTGQAVALTRGWRIDAGVGSFDLTGQGVVLRYDRRFQAEVGAYALDGQNVWLVNSAGYRMAADAGFYALDGQDTGYSVAQFWALVPPNPAVWTVQ